MLRRRKLSSLARTHGLIATWIHQSYMKTIFSTTDVHARDGFDYWHSVACVSVVRHDCKPDVQAEFKASIKQGAIGHLELVIFQNPAMTVTRRKEHVASSEPTDVFFCRPVEGAILVEQDGRQAMVDRQEMVLVDPLRP